MTHRPGLLVSVYGAFLLICGIIGFEITGETSTSSIVNGIVFGALMIVMGVLLSNGRPWTLPASASAVSIFTVTFAWRGTLQWLAVTDGDEQQTYIAVLLTLMFAVSAVVALVLLKRLRR